MARKDRFISFTVFKKYTLSSTQKWNSNSASEISKSCDPGEDTREIVRAKPLAQRYCIWSTIYHDTENMVKNCTSCRANSRSPSKGYVSWVKAETQVERVHIDMLGPFKNFIWLIVLDSIGVAEGIVQRFTNSVDRSTDSGKSLEDSVFLFLISYSSTPFDFRKSQSELFMDVKFEANLKHS
ncbi:hypothetical protein RF11_12139 [Thelohanellus kitauei]|uniref:Integrase zinc-binding domain-containing protein n=1 Tax=Thelohanellus kitauei TaxID=669202 RepID=A0A0C2MEV9_THEKT|nr:hypothetical protein RF11_12139 [Thelohanellus kitauei]